MTCRPDDYPPYPTPPREQTTMKLHTASIAGRGLLLLVLAALLFLAFDSPAKNMFKPDPVLTAVVVAAECSATYSVSPGENAYPMLEVEVTWVSGECDFSLASYDTEGPNWPTSGTQSLRDFVTATVNANHPVVNLTVQEPECFGQTDFYAGSTRYDGIDGALPHWPDSPTPFGKISGSGGGQECAEETPPPSAPPSESPRPTPSVSGSPPPSFATLPPPSLNPRPTPPQTETGGSVAADPDAWLLAFAIVALAAAIGVATFIRAPRR